MGDVLKFEDKHKLPVNVIGRNEEGKLTVNGKVEDCSTTGGVSLFDLEESPSC